MMQKLLVVTKLMRIMELAKSYYKQGKYKEAEPFFKRFLEIKEAFLGPDHPNIVSSLNNLAFVYEGQGKSKG